MSTTIHQRTGKPWCAAHGAPGNTAPRRLRGGEPRGRGLAMPPGAGRGVCERIRGGPCSGAFRRAPEKQPTPPRFARTEPSRDYGSGRPMRVGLQSPRLVRGTLQSRRGTRRRRGYGRTAIGAATGERAPPMLTNENLPHEGEDRADLDSTLRGRGRASTARRAGCGSWWNPRAGGYRDRARKGVAQRTGRA